MKDLISIEEIGKTLGVSKTTVSRAISGKGRIGSDTKKRIFDYITEIGYVPRVINRSALDAYVGGEDAR